MSVKMHQLYPNFHSLVSASSQPLDPRMRRRSLVWTRSSTEVPNYMNLSLNPAIYSIPQTTMIHPMTRPLRRRSASQAPVCHPSGQDACTPTSNGGQGSRPSPTRSSPSLSSTPPPPFPFRDCDGESLGAVEGHHSRSLAPCVRRSHSYWHPEDEEMEEGVMSVRTIPTEELVRNLASHSSLPRSTPCRTSSISHVFHQQLTPLLSVNLPLRTSFGSKEGNVLSKPTTAAFSDEQHFQNTFPQPLQQNLVPQVLSPTPVFPGTPTVGSTATPVATRRVTPGRLRLQYSEAVRRRTLVDVAATGWQPNGNGCHIAPTVKGAAPLAHVSELHCSGNCHSSDSGVDVCETESALVSVSPHDSLRSTPIGVARRSGNFRRAHVVSVFEENLTKMSQRLQAMTQTTSKKESDLHDLRNTIDLLRSQSGLLKQQTDYSEKTVSEVNPPCREVMPECVDGARTGMEGDPKAPGSKRNGWLRQSIEKAFRKKPIGQPSASHKLTNGLDPTPDRDTVARSSAQPPSSTWACDSPLLHEGPPGSRIPRNDATIETRLRSGDLSPSNSSVVSASSTWSSSRSRATATGVATPKPCGAGINHDPEDKLRKPVAERSSTLRHPEDDQSPSDFSEGTLGDASQSSCQDAVCPPTELLRLHQMLTEREMKLTDVQLQALARAHQIDDLSGQMKQLYAEVRYLRADNERLQVALSQQQQQGSVRCASRVGMPIDESGKGVDLQKHNSAPFGDHSDAIGAKMHQVSMLVSLESLAPDVSQRFKNPCPVSMGELALAFTQADCVKTWSDLDMRLHRILTQYIDRLGVRSFLGKEGLNLSGYLVEANNHSVRYRRNLRTATRVTCRTTNQAEDQPCNLEFMDVLQTLALSNSKRLKIGLHLDDWLDEFSLRSLLPKHWLGTMFNFLQTYKCLVFFSENPDELRETTELFAAQLKKTGKVSSVCPLSIDQAGLSAVKLARVIHESLRLADEYGRSLSTSSQAVRLVTIDNLQLVKSSITVLEALDLIRTTEKEPTKLPSGNSLLILANWVMEDRGRQSPGLDLPPHTVQATSTIFCTGKQCCWAAADRTTVTKGNQSDDGPRLHESQQLHQRLLNKIFIEAMDCPVGKNGDDIAHSRIEAAKTVASWLAELSLRMQGLHSTGFGPLTTGMLSAAKPATTSLMDWPALVAQDLGEAWFLANWNEHVRPVLQAASVRASTPADGLLEWVVSTWPWQGSDRQRQLRLQHCMFRLDLMPATDS